MNEIIKRKNSSRGFAINCFSIILILLFFTNISLRAQREAESSNKNIPPRHEVKDDDYSPSPRDQHAASPAYKYTIPGFTVVQVNVDEFGMNIIDDAGNEPSITFDPNDPNKMAIGWRQFDDINSNFRQAGNGFTTDGGETWTFPEVIDPGIFRSDPVLDSDAEGNFYYNGLTYAGDDYWCDVFKSTDGGATWDEGVFAQGGDKQWMTIDKSGGIGSGNIYAFWNAGYSICEPGFFTRSVDDGLTYEDCTEIEGYPYWGTTAVSGEGELYMCGASSYWGDFVVAKSSTAQIDTMPMMWDFTSTVDLDGDVIGWGGYECPNPTGILGQVYISVDSSGGPTDGNVYLLASVQRFSNPDPMDVMFARSTDGGLTWSDPIQVNDDQTFDAWQWFGTMSVAPDGRIDVVWLDTRDYPGSLLSVLYYAYSTDAGNTWSENYALSESFDPHVGWPEQDKMGDYYEMFSDETGAHLAWAATFNGEQDVYYSHITIPTSSGIAITQTEFMELFTPGNQIDMFEGENGFIDIGQIDGPNQYDFSFVDLENYYTVTNFEVNQINELLGRYPSNATLFGEDIQTIYGSPVFLSLTDSTYFEGEASIEDVYQFAHYQPSELFSGFPISFPDSFSQDFDIYDTTYNSSWQIEETEMYSESVNVTIDGYGTIELGELSYECLRMKREYLTEAYKEFLYVTKEGALFVVTDVPISEPDTGFVEADYQLLLKSDIITRLNEEQKEKTVSLSQNFPNPFTRQTNISYQLKDGGLVSLVVFDISGKEIAVLVNEQKNKGNHTVLFDASTLKHGVYYYRLAVGDEQQTKKLIIID